MQIITHPETEHELDFLYTLDVSAARIRKGAKQNSAEVSGTR